MQARRHRPRRAAAAADARDAVGHRGGIEPRDVGQEGALRHLRLVQQPLLLELLLELWDEALRIDHVARVEIPHLRGDRVCRGLAPLVAKRRAQLGGDVRDPVAAELERLDEVALRPVQLAGMARAARAVD